MAILQKTKTVKTARRTIRATVNPTYPKRFAVNNKVMADGAIVEVSEIEAVNLIARGCAADATAAEVTAAAGNVEVAPHRENNWSDA